MKRKIKTLILVIASIVFISNLPPITYFLQENYHYQNKDGSFQFSEQGGPTQDFDVAKSKFESFKLKNPDNPHKTLFRTFTLKPWRFWEWWQMIRHFERFKLPYYPKAG
ncbi:hypothetical protein OC25_17435 [Pedobacter kyungheensis]|uniref:Uncharacterized protein n=1 Tax=Pedobacter kyungheensis TaxID=1069985 RepID=A0A0C1FWJ1_9SPHI|nr:hypothetical protein [Pedobacter kyungheensis]KIA92224.1 hypothetical protein OC25_17435 [Pedobacter kyungheensis]